MTESGIRPEIDPYKLLANWLAEAEKSEPNDPNAMSLATVGEGGMPSVRMVLLKSFDSSGFVFFTNGNSKKGRQLAAHPKAAICLYWKSLRRQVRAEGPIMPVSAAENDEYFATRPRGSQLGAWASEQSSPLKQHKDLTDALVAYEKKFANKPVPRPPHWGGYRLKPVTIEFWQDREHRLHDRLVYYDDDRLVYSSGSGDWRTERLYP